MSQKQKLLLNTENLSMAIDDGSPHEHDGNVVIPIEVFT